MNTGAAGLACPVSTEFDPFSEEYHRDPARAQGAGGPVYFSEVLGWYVVTRHVDIRQVYADTESFSSQKFSDPITPLCPAAQAALDRQGFKVVTSLGALDEPLHLLRRRLIDEPFKADRVARYEPLVREVATRYLDRVVRRGCADLVADLFYEAPAEVALVFMGVPGEDIAELKGNATGVLKFVFGRPSEQEQVDVCENLGRQYASAREIVARIQADPSGEGLLPVAVRAAREAPESFDDHFLISLCINTLAAAHETTSSSLANTMLLLLDPHERWEAVCADAELIPGAIEESFRLAPALTTGRRWCVKDTVVGGVPIPAGSMVLTANAAGSRDADLFPDPDAYDHERRNAKRHLAFGYASHFCLGAPLARLQMRVHLEELARRLPHMRLASGRQIDYLRTASAHTPLSLPVEWDPAANPIEEDRP